jgi:phage antirepressor YoqD-like protein
VNQLIISNQPITSMQIAEITGKQHAHIMRDIRDEAEKLKIGGVSYESKFGLVEYTDAKGEKRPCYQLSKEGVLQLAARYDAVIRARLIELAMRQDKPQLPQTFAEALRLAADLEEERQKLLPKADQFDKFISGTNYQDMNTTAKVLGWGRNKLFAELRNRKILMSGNRPYQRYIEQGYFVVKEKPIDMGGTVFNKPQTYVTAKGLSWLEKVLNESGVMA